MKVFISWSGQLSKQLGEAIRDWLPNAIQLVNPYFTPSDIEKGMRWSTNISDELSKSQIGILCVTQDNLHSDWILFEAGALSKSLEKSRVCPILFGISNTDLAGPLKQFQTTLFGKSDFLKLVGVINDQLGESKLPPKTLENVFEKWWPDLEEKVNRILSSVNEPNKPIRPDRDVLEEILQLARNTSRQSIELPISNRAIEALLENYIILHNKQMNKEGSYQETLDSLYRMHRAVKHIAIQYVDEFEDIEKLVVQLDKLPYKVIPASPPSLDDIPF